MAKLDKDTNRVLEKQKKRKDWIESEGYEDFKKTVMMKVVEMTSLLRIQAIPGYTQDQLLSEYGALRRVGGILVQVLGEIEGDANAYTSNWKMLNEQEVDSMQIYFPQKAEE